MIGAERVFGHLSFNYRPGEGALAARFFEALGCTVKDSGPLSGSNSLYTVFLGPETAMSPGNVYFYLVPVRSEQAAFEERLAAFLAAEKEPSFTAFRALKAKEPELFFHFALRYTTLESLETAALNLDGLKRSVPQLEGRIRMLRFRPRSAADPGVNARIASSPVFRADDRPSFGDLNIQVFIHTDLFAGELLTLGQTLELGYVFPTPEAQQSAG